MQNNYSIFEYYSASSRIHRLSAIFKIISLIILIISLILSKSVVSLCVINIYIFLILLWSKISFKLYFSNLKVFRFLLFIVFVLVSLFSLDILLGLVWTLKVFDLLIYLIIITITTSLNDMVIGIYRLLKPFKDFFDTRRFSLSFALFFKFFGICYSEYNRIKTSQIIRGVRFSDMNFFNKVEYLVNGIKPVLKKSLKKIKLLRKNMYVRNFGVSDNISNYRLNKWGIIDTMLLVVNVLILIVVYNY